MSITIQHVDEDEMQLIYNWVDQIPLTRPKKNITRDFSDGVLLAEVIHHFIPKLVQMHNYSSQHSVDKKMYNWQTLNSKVFKKLGFQLSKLDIQNVVKCKPDCIEKVLRYVQGKIATYKQGSIIQRSPPESIQHSKILAPSGRKAPGVSKIAQGGLYNQPGQQQQQQQQQQAVPQPAGQWNLHSEVDTQILIEKQQRIQQLRETIEILEMKIKKLEQLVQLKDSKIQALTMKLQEFTQK